MADRRALYLMALGVMLPDAAYAQAGETMASRVRHAIDTNDVAALTSAVSYVRWLDSAEAISGAELLSELGQCTLEKEHPSLGNRDITFLFYGCPERRKAASGCFSGDLSLAVDASDSGIRIVKGRTAAPECAPAISPSPTSSSEQR